MLDPNTLRSNKYFLPFIQAALLLLFISIFCCTLVADPYFNFDYVNEDQGVLDSSVEAIAQDADGYMWFGTHNGVFQFDGINSKKYVSDGLPGSILSDDIYQIILTSDNTLWFATATAGVAYFDKNTNEFFHISDTTKPHSISHYRVKSILEFNEKLWLLTDTGVDTLDQASFASESVKLKKSNNEVLQEFIGTSLAIFDDTLWTIYADKLYRLDLDNLVFEPFDFDDYQKYAYRGDTAHYAIYAANNGNMYIHTKSGLFRVDKKLKQISKENLPRLENGEERIRITKIFVDSNGTTWILQIRGGVYYSFIDDPVYHKVPIGIGANQLNTEYFYTIFEDKSKNLWLGTDGNFVAKFRASQNIFPFYSNQYVLKKDYHTDNIWAFLDHQDKFYIGADNGVFILEDDETLTPLLTNAPYKPTFALLPVGNSMYIGGYNGLYEYLPSGVVNNLSHLVSDNVIGDSKEDVDVIQLAQSDRHLIIGTFSGLILIDKGSGEAVTFTSQSKEHTLVDNWVLTLEYNAASEQVWIGTPYGGQVISTAETESPVQKISFLEANKAINQIADPINDFYFDDGHVWIATDNGFYRYTPEQVLLEYRFFPDNNIRAIEMVNDIFWLSTSKGLLKAPVDNIADFKYYVREDGLYNTGNTQKSSYYSKEKNLLFFGGDRGFISFDPDIKIPESIPLVPRLRSINLVNQRNFPEVTQKVLTEGKLEHSENSLRFDYAYLEFKAPKRNRFKYQLEGFDDDWSALTAKNSVTYTNLESGNYKFRVKAYDANNNLSDDELSIEFRIKTAWWKTTVAYAAYFLLAILAFMQLWGMFKKAQKRKERLQFQANKEAFINGYNRYALSLTELHAYQTMVRKFLDQVKLITGANFLYYQQFLNEELLEISVGDFYSGDDSELQKIELMSKHTIAQLTMNIEDPSILKVSTADIQILFQQMIILQGTLLDRQKYNWNDYFNAATGLYNNDTFIKILQDEFERAEKNNVPMTLFEWHIDQSRFRENELLKRIQLLSYGDQVKFVFGHHVIATFIEQNHDQPYLLIFLGEVNDQDCEKYEASMQKVIYENRISLDNSNADLELIKIIRLQDDFSDFLNSLKT